MSGFDTTYRIRLGNYRVVYIVDDAARVITVTRFGHRRGVYR
ncbi:type II toxin-antitoxin system RelE/ParE family toxin [Mycobacterium tuberculosis]|nr:type II toxin-antitoxin system RelE/ParE family toxin [Mycobacterium tuberculosis]